MSNFIHNYTLTKKKHNLQINYYDLTNESNNLGGQMIIFMHGKGISIEMKFSAW